MTPLSDEALRLISDASGADGPPPARLRAISRRLLPKLAAGGAVALSAAKASALAGAAAPIATKAAAFGAGSLVSSLLAGGAAGAVVVVAGALWRGPSAREIPAPVLAPSSAITAPAPPRQQVPPSVAPEQPPEATEAPLVQPPRSAPELPSADPASTLAAEVHLLNGAQHWISVGDGARALAIVDRYLTEHPRGALREELLAARVLALCLSGDHAAARNAAQAFVAKSPRSPQLPRLARSCAAGVEGLPAPVDSATDSTPGGD